MKSHVSAKTAHARMCAVINAPEGQDASSISSSKKKKRRLSLSLKGKHRFQAASDRASSSPQH